VKYMCKWEEWVHEKATLFFDNIAKWKTQ